MKKERSTNQEKAFERKGHPVTGGVSAKKNHPSKWLLLHKGDTWVRPYLKKYRKLLILVLFLGLLTFLCGAALMFTSGYLISAAAAHPYNILAIYVPIVLTRAFGIGRPSFRYVERLTSHNWVLRMTSDIRLKLYRSLAARTGEGKLDLRSGDILGILNEDIEHVQNLYLRTIFPTLIAWLLYVLVVVALGCFSIPFALVMLLLIGVLVVVLPLVSILANQAVVYRRKAKRHQLYAGLTDSVLGVGDWQYSGRYDAFLSHYQAAEDEAWLEEEKLLASRRYQNLAAQFVFGCMVVSLVFWVGNYFYGTGTEGLNWVAAFVLAIFPLMDAFGPVSEGVMELPQYEDTVRRLHDLPDPPDEEVQSERISLEDFTVRFKDVSFAYCDQGRPVLRHFDFAIPQGEAVAVLGRSGTGKTTLVNLILGDLVPTEGGVTIGEVEARSVAESYSSCFAVLDQAPHLFNTSIKNNIYLGNLHATEKEVEAAIDQAGLRLLVDGLPEGVETVVEEGGKRFSGGERQRIALARTLLQNAPIIILDEPTVGLDPLTEGTLLDTLFTVLKGKTILWVTHHLIGIEHVDRVVFLADGAIEMEGEPRELLERSSHFQHLYQLDRAR